MLTNSILVLPFALLILSVSCTAWLAWALGRRSVLRRLRELADQALAMERLHRGELEKARAGLRKGEIGTIMVVSLVDQMDEAHERHQILDEALARLSR